MHFDQTHILMNMKNYILSVVLIAISISTSAQVEADINRPSINAEQFGFALKAETALNKGQLSINIPLMELKGKGYNLPISLSFYSGDVTCTTEASPIGLGWALMAGGVIAATIRGTDDIEDYIQDGKDDHHTDSNYIDKIPKATFPYDLLDRIRLNSMPDEYTYSLPEHSGIIEVSVDDQKRINRTLFPDESYKIEKTTNGYCITADDGTKFYFEAKEWHVTGTWPETQESTSYFLTEIKTTKGGQFIFTYADEDYCDLSGIRDYVSNWNCDIYHTKRITRIESPGYGSITFDAVKRDDRGEIGLRSIPENRKSKRICKIELRDENNRLIKGYELDNSGTFNLEDKKWEEPSTDWYNYRHKLSSITQYDAAGNRLPPYEFTYDYRFSKSRMLYSHNEKDVNGNYIPYDSWTSDVGCQVYVDLYGGPDGSYPYCLIDNNAPNSRPTGWTESSGDGDPTTADDYFCLARICYPTGAIDAYTYEPHRYNKINNTQALPNYMTKIQGRRLAMKKRYSPGLQQWTKYVYRLHDANYNTTGLSGVLTNPSIHSATYYTPEYTVITDLHSYGWVLRASRISSGKPFNSFMGPAVCYTEVEEVIYDEYNDSLRTIHYFEPQTVSPPVNYVLLHPQHAVPQLIKIENRIFGKKSGYRNGMQGCNNGDYTYLAYPVGEFYNSALLVDKPLKEVLIGRDGRVRSIKRYSYDTCDWNIGKKYGYKVVSPENADYTMISRSEYITRRFRLMGTNTTSYYYDDEKCDSVCEEYIIRYNKGRTKNEYSHRESGDLLEKKSSQYYYPDDISNIAGNNTSPELAAMNGLIGKNMIREPIKTVIRRNGLIVNGECKDYQMVSGEPLLKSLYKLKNAQNSADKPTVDDNAINYHVDMYKAGEILTYDEYKNPEHVKLNDTMDRIYVWGYGGRYPIAVIDNMNETKFQSTANLKTKILELETYRKIDSGDGCASLRSLNADIRALLPPSAHITTYTYDPYFGMTSETDDSNLGVIYTYDSFGRLTAKYDENYKKLEEYNYHLKLQK